MPNNSLYVVWRVFEPWVRIFRTATSILLSALAGTTNQQEETLGNNSPSEKRRAELPLTQNMDGGDQRYTVLSYNIFFKSSPFQTHTHTHRKKWDLHRPLDFCTKYIQFHRSFHFHPFVAMAAKKYLQSWSSFPCYYYLVVTILFEVVMSKFFSQNWLCISLPRMKVIEKMSKKVKQGYPPHVDEIAPNLFVRILNEHELRQKLASLCIQPYFASVQLHLKRMHLTFRAADKHQYIQQKELSPKRDYQGIAMGQRL